MLNMLLFAYFDDYQPQGQCIKILSASQGFPFNPCGLRWRRFFFFTPSRPVGLHWGLCTFNPCGLPVGRGVVRSALRQKSGRTSMCITPSKAGGRAGTSCLYTPFGVELNSIFNALTLAIFAHNCYLAIVYYLYRR